MTFWIGVIIGVIVGANLGAVMLAFCMAANERDGAVRTGTAEMLRRGARPLA